jgi:hypothetical protein
MLARPSSVVVQFAVALCLLGSLLSAADVLAQDKKAAGTAKFGPTFSQTMLLPPDTPKHEVMLVNRIQTWTSTDPDWNNVESNQFVYSDYTAGASYEGLTTRRTNAEGSWEAKFEGKLRFTGGTGTFQGITGTGAYIGKASAPGGSTPTAATFEWQVEYSLPK